MVGGDSNAQEWWEEIVKAKLTTNGPTTTTTTIESLLQPVVVVPTVATIDRPASEVSSDGFVSVFLVFVCVFVCVVLFYDVANRVRSKLTYEELEILMEAKIKQRRAMESANSKHEKLRGGLTKKGGGVVHSDDDANDSDSSSSDDSVIEETRKMKAKSKRKRGSNKKDGKGEHKKINNNNKNNNNKKQKENDKGNNKRLKHSHEATSSEDERSESGDELGDDVEIDKVVSFKFKGRKFDVQWSDGKVREHPAICVILDAHDECLLLIWNYFQKTKRVAVLEWINSRPEPKEVIVEELTTPPCPRTCRGGA